MKPQNGNTAIALDRFYEPTAVENALRFVGNATLANEVHDFTPEHVREQLNTEDNERRLQRAVHFGDFFDVFLKSQTFPERPAVDATAKDPTIDDQISRYIGYGSELLIKGDSAQVVLDALVAASKVKGRKFEKQGLPKSTPMLAKIMLDEYKALI